MKTNKIKKAVLAVTLAASMAIPTATSLGSAMTANAASNKPFCADTDNNGAYNFQESQIVVVRDFYSTDIKNISVRKSGNTFVSRGWVRNLEPLSHAVISLKINGNNINKEKLKELDLIVNYSIGDKGVQVTYDAESEIEVDSSGNYYVKFNIVTYGESFTLKTSDIEGIDKLNCSEAIFEPISDSDNYLKLDVRPVEGEKLFIRIKNEARINLNYVENWAKRLCLYANSLSKTTGINLDTLYMEYDNTESYTAFSANYRINSNEDKYGFVAFGSKASSDEREEISTGRNVITWSTLHEVAHSYACNVKQSKFFNNYDFRQQNGTFIADFDEYLTNARGLTAIQNCDNLRNTDVHYRHNCSDYYEKYYDIAHTVASVYPNNCFKYLDRLTTYFEWEELETFFAAESDNDPDGIERKEVAKWLNNKLNMDIQYTENYLKFANNFRKLSVIKYGNYEDSNLSNIVRGRMGYDLIKAVIKDLKLDEF